MKRYAKTGAKSRSLPRTVKYVAALVLAAAILFSAPFALVAAVTAAETVTVVIDAGHGGADGGVTGATTGVKESDLNLEMAKVLGEYLESAGFRVVYTRKNKDDLCGGGGFDKRKDMYKRAEIIKRSAPAAVVSLHMNSFPSSSRRGAQVFFERSSEEGAAFASVVQDRLNEALNVPDAGRKFAALSAEKFLLEQSPAPAIIVECGFLSNPSDEKNLTSPSYRAKFAYEIFKGIAAYLSAQKI